MLLSTSHYLVFLLAALAVGHSLIAPAGTAWHAHLMLAKLLLIRLSGWATGLLTPLSLGVLALLLGLCELARRRGSALAISAAIVLALALALHRLPGFTPLVLFQGKLDAHSSELRLSWQLDKLLAGLSLMLLWRPEARPRPWRQGGGQYVAIMLLLATTLALAVTLGLIQWAPRPLDLPALHWAFGNLFLTCFAEEVLFRFLLQDELTHRWQDKDWGDGAAVLLGALLFGSAHLAGGVPYALLAALAGVAYGWAYQLSRRRWVPVLLHFGFNAAHFFLFTYPFAVPK